MIIFSLIYYLQYKTLIKLCHKNYFLGINIFFDKLYLRLSLVLLYFLVPEPMIARYAVKSVHKQKLSVQHQNSYLRKHFYQL